MKSLLDSSFRYTPAVSTDLAKTFARVRREQNMKPDKRVKPVVPDNVRKIVVAK